MNEALTIGGVAALSTVVPGLLMFFALSRAFKGYVKDAIGKLPETTTVIANQPLMVKNEVRYATHSELEAVKREARQRHEEFERRASEFRKGTEKKLGEIDQHISSIPNRVIALLKDTKDLL